MDDARTVVSPDPHQPESVRAWPASKPSLADQLLLRPPLTVPAQPVLLVPAAVIHRTGRRASAHYRARKPRWWRREWSAVLRRMVRRRTAA
jgi:hypothetical protein